MKIHLFLYCLLFGFLVCIRLQGQASEGQRLHLALKDASIGDLVTAIESQTHLHFYYDKGQFDSLRINIAESQLTLQKLMEFVFAGTNFHYSIFGSQVFLTKEKALSFSLLQE